MQKLFYISSRLSKIKHSDKELEAISSFMSVIKNNEAEQKNFFNYCKRWKLVPWVYVQLNRLELFHHLSEEVRDLFRNFYEKIKAQNENRNQEARSFLKKFAENNIRVAILKGNLLIHRTYKDVGYKKMNDFDMLIYPKDWKKVQKLYEELNYIPLGFGWAGEKQEPAKFSHAGMSFISPNYKCITGTQWGLKSPTSKYKPDFEDIWETSSEFDFYGVNTRQLTPEYNILHLILHLGIYKIGIRDCMDIYNIFLSEEINEDKLYQILIESNALDKAYFALTLCNLCSDSINRKFLERIKPKKNTFIINRLNSRLKMAEKTGDFQLSYNDFFHEIENNVFYLGIFPHFHRKIYFYYRIVKFMFWPDKDTVYKLSDISAQAGVGKKIKARLKAPVFSFALIGEEIGLHITFLLLFKLFFDTLISIKNYFVKAESYFDYLKRINVNVEDIKKAVKEIQ